MIDGCASLFSHPSSHFCVPSSVPSACLLSLLVVVFPFELLFCCFVCSDVFQVSSTPGSRSLPPTLPVFVCRCVAATQTFFSQKRSHSHTQSASHRHTQHASHTHADTDPTHALSQFLNPSHTRAHTRANPDRCQRTNQTHAQLGTRTLGRTHASVCTSLLASVSSPCVSSNPACTSECGAVVVSVGPCYRTVRLLSAMLPPTVTRRALRCCCERAPTSALKTR